MKIPLTTMMKFYFGLSDLKRFLHFVYNEIRVFSILMNKKLVLHFNYLNNVMNKKCTYPSNIHALVFFITKNILLIEN